MNYSNLKLTDKYFSHSKSIYYREWHDDLIKAILYHRPTLDNGIISFFFCECRCHYQLEFSAKTGECLGIRQHFISTKIEMEQYVFPLIELISSLVGNGYLEYKNSESEE